jgi:hypothetical protein
VLSECIGRGEVWKVIWRLLDVRPAIVSLNTWLYVLRVLKRSGRLVLSVDGEGLSKNCGVRR